MDAQQWKQVLAQAAAASPEAQARLGAVVRLLAQAAAGQLDPAALKAVFPQPYPAPAPFVTALEEAARSGHGRMAPATLAALRATLRIVPDLIDQIRRLGPRAQMPARGPDSVPEALRRLAAEADTSRSLEQESRAGRGALRCPRCGSYQVERRHTDVVGGRFVEVRCGACSHYESWSAGDPVERRWQAGR